MTFLSIDVTGLEILENQVMCRLNIKINNSGQG